MSEHLYNCMTVIYNENVQTKHTNMQMHKQCFPRRQYLGWLPRCIKGCPSIFGEPFCHFFLLFLDLSEYNSISNRLTSGQSGLILSTDIADALTETHPRAPIVIPDSPIVMYAYVCCCFVKVF